MRAVFLESNTSGTGALLCRRARARGHEPLLLARRPELYPFVQTDQIEVLQVDTSDEPGLRALLEPRRAEISALTTSSEYFVASAGRLARILGLPAPPVEAVEICRNKGQLARFLAAADVRVPASRVVRSELEVERAVDELGLPVVVKPVSGSGSVSVRRADTLEQARSLVAALLAVRVNERGMPVPDEVLLQELVAGREYSVEAVGTHIVGVTSKHLGGPDGSFVEAGHDYPARGPLSEIEAVQSLCRRALQALQFTAGATHTEIKVGRDGPAVIEVNPRLAGGFIPELVRLATGVDLLEATLSVALGQPAELQPQRQGHASIRFLMPEREGVLDELAGLPEARRMPLVSEVSAYRQPGSALSWRGDFRDRVGHVIAVGDDPELTARAAERARSAVVVRLRGSDTGRIRGAIPEEARAILFGASVDAQLPALRLQLEVDRAHLVMLAEQGVLPADKLRRLLVELDRLERADFADLRGKAAPRGMYLLYEQHLIERTGPDSGGMLQLGRSRNDLQATVTLLKLRRSAAAALREHLALVEQLLLEAREHQRLLMPAYTHGQPATPITLGHYLAGVAEALSRDADGLHSALGACERCPLGAGAVGGTTVAIRPERTAELLGFAGPLLNSVDGVASRDAVLRVLAAAAITGTTTSRLAADLMAWLGDGALLELPDHLVGSSSMMPQKRNPYLLEHVQGRAARPLGAFVAAATAMHAKPFTNHIAVGTEGVAEVEQALADHRGALVLLRLVVGGMLPRAERMAERAEQGFVQATEIATALAADEALGFRGAHALVGRAVTRALSEGVSLEQTVASELAAAGRPPLQGDFGLPSIAGRCEHAGGPGERALEAELGRLEQGLDERRARLVQLEERWDAAREALAASERRLREGRGA
jgi:argininosuccinate lyase